ncbi:hypothetical protein [Escherichia coli]|uniref:hypothetical protein n=1 Tax=Escherichia coli TaxID=562 RepID=UPI001432B102|nr:hypothetical protein [Escherichia coli]
MTPLLELKDIRRSYPAGDEQVEVLKGISLDIYAGEMVAVKCCVSGYLTARCPGELWASRG